MPSLASSFNPAVGPLIQVGVAPWGAIENYTLFDALLDTGASHTSISPNVVKALQLEATGMRLVATASDVRRMPIYTASLVIPFGETLISLPDQQLSQFLAPDQFDIILGRDVICRGQLHISFDGHLVFSL